MSEQPDGAAAGPEGIVEPQQDRSQESTRRLLDAAAELVAERGFDDATVAAIGERAGYSRGLVGSRFGSKENLMWALVQRSTETWFQRLVEPPAEGTGLEQLLALVNVIGEHSSADPNTLRVLERLIFEAGSNQALQARFVASQQMMDRNLAELLRRGIEDGSIRDDIDPDLEAALLVATLRGISYQWFLYPEDVDIVGLHQALSAQLLDRLGLSSGRRRSRAPRGRPRPN
jgi:AcrR family transcriptional regulator